MRYYSYYFIIADKGVNKGMNKRALSPHNIKLCEVMADQNLSYSRSSEKSPAEEISKKNKPL